MGISFFTPSTAEVTSRYGLLGAMLEEMGSAFRESGHDFNPPAAGSADLSIYAFMNFPERARDVLAWANLARPRTALLHIFVDHPFAMDDRQMDEFSRAPGYRLVLPCADETSLMPMRWPGLKFVRVPHAIPASALAPAASIEPGQASREFDVVAAGSIPTVQDIATRRAAAPATAHRACDDIIELMVEHPTLGFMQAFDLTVGSGMAGADQWRMLRWMWRYVTDSVNRRRRLALLASMQGLRTAVFGPEVWREHCSGTIQYRGEAPYSGAAAAMASAKVCLAWSPTQFIHSWSERILLSMAAGCATVTDDRLLVRRELGGAVSTFDAGSPASCRAAVEALLGDDGARTALALRGRAEVAARHLWSHRLPALAAISAGAAGIAPVGAATRAA